MLEEDDKNEFKNGMVGWKEGRRDGWVTECSDFLSYCEANNEETDNEVNSKVSVQIAEISHLTKNLFVI